MRFLRKEFNGPSNTRIVDRSLSKPTALFRITLAAISVLLHVSVLLSAAFGLLLTKVQIQYAELALRASVCAGLKFASFACRILFPQAVRDVVHVGGRGVQAAVQAAAQAAAQAAGGIVAAEEVDIEEGADVGPPRTVARAGPIVAGRLPNLPEETEVLNELRSALAAFQQERVRSLVAVAAAEQHAGAVLAEQQRARGRVAAGCDAGEGELTAEDLGEKRVRERLEEFQRAGRL